MLENESDKQRKNQIRPRSDLVATTTVTLDLADFTKRISNPLKPILKLPSFGDEQQIEEP
jgi:hypothetical protein